MCPVNVDLWLTVSLTFQSDSLPKTGWTGWTAADVKNRVHFPPLTEQIIFFLNTREKRFVQQMLTCDWQFHWHFRVWLPTQDWLRWVNSFRIYDQSVPLPHPSLGKEREKERKDLSNKCWLVIDSFTDISYPRLVELAEQLPMLRTEPIFLQSLGK